MSHHFPNSSLSSDEVTDRAKSASPLHEGLLAIAAASQSGVRADVILDLLGWKTDFPLSCAEAGRRHGLSRERVRQMKEAFLLSFMTRVSSVWERVAARAAKATILSRTALGEMCRNDGLCLEGEYPWGFIAILAHRGLLDGAVAVSQGRRGLLGDDMQAERFLRATQSLEARIKKRGVLNIGPFLSACPAEMASELLGLIEDANGPAVRDDGIWIFSADREWAGRGFGLSIAKMFAVAGKLDVKEIAAGLARGPRTRSDRFPEQIVGRMAIASGVAVLDENGIYCRADGCSAHVLAPAERKLVDALRDLGGRGTRSDIIAACEKRGLNATTVNLYLSWAPFMIRSGVGVYELIGAGKSAENVAVSGYCVAFRKRITPSTLRNGVVNLPSSCRGAAPGKVVCTDASGHALGHIRIGESAISGLRRHLRHLDCAAGQSLVIEFDPLAKKARLGIEEIPA